jgi:plasmid stability protein
MNNPLASGSGVVSTVNTMLSCYHQDMAQLIVRSLDDDVAAKLKARAKRHGRSMEDEIRHILRDAASADEGRKLTLGTRIASRFALSGLDDDLPELRGQTAIAAAWKR